MLLKRTLFLVYNEMCSLCVCVCNVFTKADPVDVRRRRGGLLIAREIREAKRAFVYYARSLVCAYDISIRRR